MLTAVASRDRQRAATFLPAAYRALNYEELVAAPDVDLIYLALPNHLHEEWAIRALGAGKHVICEKPLGLDHDSVERMLSCAEERGLLLYENLMYLQHPQHAMVKEIVSRGEIGRLVTLRSVFGFPLPAGENFRCDPRQGGGAFHDLARYPLGTALYFLQGEEYRFRGFAVERHGLNVGMHGVARTSADETFTFTMAFGQQYESYYEIIGEQGKIRVDRAYTTPADLANRVQVLVGMRDLSFIVPASDQFLLTIDGVCGLIRAGGPYDEQHQRARRLARLAESMYKGCRNE